MRTDRLQIRARRQPAHVHAARPPVPQPGVPGLHHRTGHEHHRRRAPDRRHLRSRRRQDARRRPPRKQVDGGDRGALHRGFPRRRPQGQHPPGRQLPTRDRLHPADARAGREAHRARACVRSGRHGLLRHRELSRVWKALAQLNRKIDGGPSRRARPAQAASRRLRAVEVRRRAPNAGLAESLGTGLPRMAHRVLGDVDVDPR